MSLALCARGSLRFSAGLPGGAPGCVCRVGRGMPQHCVLPWRNTVSVYVVCTLLGQDILFPYCVRDLHWLGNIQLKHIGLI